MTVPSRPIRHTRRDFLRLTAAAALLAACGTSSDDDGASDGGGASDAAPTTRSVTSDAGPVEVPAAPERVIAAIGSFETDMVAVGVMPVLTTTFAGPWVELDDSVTITKNIPPTAEELLVADPDLMIGWSWVTAEPGFDAMKKIAPYVGLGESAAYGGSLESMDALIRGELLEGMCNGAFRGCAHNGFPIAPGTAYAYLSGQIRDRSNPCKSCA